MRKENYLKVKHYVKSLCLDSVNELCNKIGLTEQEIDLMQRINRGDMRVCIGLEMGMCESAVSKNCHKVFTKIKDYLIKNNIDF